MMEYEIIHDMYVLGLDPEFLADIFQIQKQRVQTIWSQLSKKGRSQHFNLAQMSATISRFLIMKFTRDLHTLPVSRAIELLPDLLKIKDDPAGQTEETLDALVLPKKSPYEPIDDPAPPPSEEGS